MVKIIDKNRTDTALSYSDTIVQKRDIDRITPDIIRRLEELAKKPKEQLTDTEREEIKVSADFAQQLMEISKNHQYASQYIAYSQEIRKVLKSHFQEIQQVCEDTRTQTGELKCEIPPDQPQHNIDIYNEPYLGELEAQILVMNSLVGTYQQAVQQFFHEDRHIQAFLEKAKFLQWYSWEVSNWDIVKITRIALLDTLYKKNHPLFTQVYTAIKNSSDTDWRETLDKFDLRWDTLSNTQASESALDEVGKKLSEINNAVREGKIPRSFFREVVDGFKESQNNPQERHQYIFLLSGIFSWFNRMWIGIEMRYDDARRGLYLVAPQGSAKSNSRASLHDVQEYQNMLDSIQSLLSPQDIQRIFLYRTTQTLHSYLGSTRMEDRNTTNYIFHLLGTQWIREIRADFDDDEQYADLRQALQHMESQWNARSREYLQTALWSLSPERFQTFLRSVARCIKERQTEKEYILIYFQDLYYNRERQSQNDENNHVNDYADFIRARSPDIQHLFQQLETLDVSTRTQLWLESSDAFDHFMKLMEDDPMAGLAYGASHANWSAAIGYGLLVGIISKLPIFRSIRGVQNTWAVVTLAGITWLMSWSWWWSWLLSVVGKGGRAFFWWEDESWDWGEWVDIARVQERQGYLYYDPTNDTDAYVRSEWNDLARKENFRSADAKILTFFQTWWGGFLAKDQTAAAYFTKTFGIQLTNQNKPFYERIFRDLWNKKQPHIGDPVPNETVEAYMKRTQFAPADPPPVDVQQPSTPLPWAPID